MIKNLCSIAKEYEERDDAENAYKYYLEAALMDDPEAIKHLAIMYLYGNGVEQNFEKAFYYLGMFYDLTGEVEGMYEVADDIPEIRASYEGRYAYRKYIDHLFKAEQSSDNKSYLPVIDILKGSELLQGDIYERNVPGAIQCYEEAAELGESFGNELIGELYFLGNGVEQDYEKAFEYFQKSKEYRSFSKHYYLGEMYLNGLYVEKDIDKAICEFKSITDDADDYKEIDQFYDLAVEELKKITGEGFWKKRRRIKRKLIKKRPDGA